MIVALIVIVGLAVWLAAKVARKGTRVAPTVTVEPTVRHRMGSVRSERL